ncbi:MAG: NADH:flavin oxidoreductase [Anaerosomatales bacterium]
MSHLLQPLEGKLPLANRLVMPPMATQKAGEDGTMSREILDYYDEKSRGGHIGLVIIEHAYVHQQGKYRARQPGVADDGALPRMAELATTIHRNGPRAVMQINHSGGAASSEVTGLEVVAPSAVPSPVSLGGETPRSLTRDDIAGVVEAFAAAARRVKQAGFDGVEIHAAHGYLLSQFLSPLTNVRTDEYGGDLAGRIRIHLEVIAAVRAAVGEEFPVLLRLGASDYLDGGTTLEDGVAAAIEFEKAGVDLVDVTGGHCSYLRPGHTEQGYFAELSSAILEAVSNPVMLTGGITDPLVAERLLAEGAADLIGVGRAILKDSGWAGRAVSMVGYDDG